MRRKRLIITAIIALCAITAGFTLFNIANAQLGLQDKVQSCFKRYTKGVSYSQYYVHLTKTLNDFSREAVGNDQIVCAITRLGFKAEKEKAMLSSKYGRFDNTDFAVAWRQITHSECLKTSYTKSDSAFGVCTKSRVTGTDLQITLIDYR